MKGTTDDREPTPGNDTETIDMKVNGVYEGKRYR